MIRSLKDLEVTIGYSLLELKAILEQLPKYYYHFSGLKRIERGIKLYRHYHPSKMELRDVHNRLLTRVFDKIVLPEHIQGCVKGRSNITNAKLHQGRPYKFHTDIVSYFDFVTYDMVYAALLDLGFSADVASLLTRLTTFKGHLPQGPPTSTFLGNIAGLRMDEGILTVCRANGILYTRFVDDLCFSSRQDFKQQSLDIISVVRLAGLRIGHNKTLYKKGRMVFTGADVGNNSIRRTKAQDRKYHDPATPDHTRKGLDAYFKGLQKK